MKNKHIVIGFFVLTLLQTPPTQTGFIEVVAQLWQKKEAEETNILFELSQLFDKIERLSEKSSTRKRLTESEVNFLVDAFKKLSIEKDKEIVSLLLNKKKLLEYLLKESAEFDARVTCAFCSNKALFNAVFKDPSEMLKIFFKKALLLGDSPLIELLIKEYNVKVKGKALWNVLNKEDKYKCYTCKSSDIFLNKFGHFVDYLAIAKLLVEKNKNVVNYDVEDESYPLDIAKRVCSVEVIDYLIDNGAISTFGFKAFADKQKDHPIIYKKCLIRALVNGEIGWAEFEKSVSDFSDQNSSQLVKVGEDKNKNYQSVYDYIKTLLSTKCLEIDAIEKFINKNKAFSQFCCLKELPVGTVDCNNKFKEYQQKSCGACEVDSNVTISIITPGAQALQKLP